MAVSSRELKVEAIFIEGYPHHPVNAESYLSTLSDPAWAQMREDATRSSKVEKPLLRCGDCEHPVFVRESKAGRRHCCHFGTNTKQCRWSSANAQNVASIDADKFRGNQEGDRHKNLKKMIYEILSFDTQAAAAGIILERYTKGSEGDYAYPDVFAAQWQCGPAAFELQLATTHLPTIIRREDFYRSNNIRLCWIVGDDKNRLHLRTYKDIYFRNDGQILSIDGDVKKAAIDAQAPRFRLYRLLPGPISKQLTPDWKDRIVEVDDINWGAFGDRPKSKHKSYDEYLEYIANKDERTSVLREQFFAALASCNEVVAGQVWDEVVSIVGGKEWKFLRSSYDTVRAFGVLATVQNNKVNVLTELKIEDIVQIANSMLLEPIQRRCWTKAFKSISTAKNPDLLSVSSVMQKISRNEFENSFAESSDCGVGQVFNVFFPHGAFQRLSMARE